MGYYIDIRPKDSTPLTREAYKQRFIDFGLEQHHGLYDEYQSEAGRESNRFDVLFSGGYITICDDETAPSGVVASARLSWSYDAQGIRALAMELLMIARGTNSEVIHPVTSEALRPDNLDSLVDVYCGNKRRIGKFLGFCKPPPADSKDST